MRTVVLIFLLGLAGAANSFAAVSKTDSGTNNHQAASAASNDLTTFTVTAGSTCLVAILDTQGSVTATSVKWDNAGTPQTMTAAGNHASGIQRVEIFFLTNPTSGNKTLHAAWTTSRASVLAAIAFTGTDTTTCVKVADEVQSGATSTTASVTITSNTNGATVAGCDLNSGATGNTQTQFFSNTASNDVYGSYALGGTSNVHSWTLTSGAWNCVGVHVQDPTSTAYTATVADASFGNEISSRLFGAVRPVNDSGVTADNSARIYGAPRAGADAATGNDVNTRIYGAVRQIADRSISPEFGVRAFSGARSPFDSSFTVEASSRLYASNRSGSESQNASDAVTRIYGSVRRGTDATLLPDSSVRLYAAARSLSEVWSGAEFIARVLAAWRSSSDSAVDAESGSRLYSAGRNAAEAGNGAERGVRVYSAVRPSTEAAITTEFNGRLYASLRLLADALNASDISSRIAGHNAQFTENMADSGTAFESSRRSLTLSRSQFEAAVSVDTGVRSYAGARLLFDSVGLDENVARSRGAVRSSVDNSAAFDAGSGIRFPFAPIVLLRYQFSLTPRITDMLMQKRIQDFLAVPRITDFKVK